MDNNLVLVIEDEVKLARFMELELKHEGYEVDVAHDGVLGLALFSQKRYNLVLLDLMLPKINGLEVCRTIRENSDCPIIMLTAKDEITDKVTGLDGGADDYITKPFAIEEVLARMRVAIKRHTTQHDKKPTLQFKNITINSALHQVMVDENVIELTKKEFELFYYLLQNRNIVLSREQILNEVWGYEYIGETNVVDVYVRYLRTKIDEPHQTKYIHTVRGVGYVVKDE